MEKVLLLDNDEAVLDVMQEALTFAGFNVRCIEQTSDIFPEIEDYHPDVVVFDYLLNGVNGGEICHQIKGNKRTSALPVIIVSAYPKVLRSLGSYGCDDFIPKPFDLDDLTARIKRLTGKRRDGGLHAV
ncbi:MAG: response regulator [Bacteroidetes bacterium]|nr:response regulator [Bacteroidota bacterium]